MQVHQLNKSLASLPTPSWFSAIFQAVHLSDQFSTSLCSNTKVYAGTSMYTAKLLHIGCSMMCCRKIDLSSTFHSEQNWMIGNSKPPVLATSLFFLRPPFNAAQPFNATDTDPARRGGSAHTPFRANTLLEDLAGVPWQNVHAWNVLVTFWHPRNVHLTQHPLWQLKWTDCSSTPEHFFFLLHMFIQNFFTVFFTYH